MKSTSCRTIRQSLVLFAEGELESAVRQEIREHIDGCAACRAEYEDIAKVRSWLRDPELCAPSETPASRTLPETLARQLAGAGRPEAGLGGAGRSVARQPFGTGVFSFPWGPAAWASGLAATILLACGVVWWVYRPDSVPVAAVPPQRGVAPENDAFLDKMHAAYARGATARYLAECEDLLVNLMRAERNCVDAKYDVSLEVARARELLQRKRMLEPELRLPGVARARDLCDELEDFLVNLSTAERCESPAGLRHMERVIEQQRLLLRINVLQSELS